MLESLVIVVGLLHCATCMQSAARTFKCCQGRAAAAPPADGVRHHYGKRSAVPAILSCGPEGRSLVIRGGFVNVWQYLGE
ncbi:hypothetical protein Cthiooxydans_17650 [Comamonas thiooxydans]|nr:hypothetical protein Cthiooxydans_17650 [Comamonas thiooxydans]